MLKDGAWLQETRQNKRSRRELIESTQTLLDLVNRASREINTVKSDPGPMSRGEIETKFEDSPELTGGVRELLR